MRASQPISANLCAEQLTTATKSPIRVEWRGQRVRVHRLLGVRLSRRLEPSYPSYS